MIDIQFAELPEGVPPRIPSSFVLGVWEQLLKNSAIVRDYSTRLSLDIICTEAPKRPGDRISPLDDWMDEMERAYRRGTAVKSRFLGNRAAWIMVYGHVSNLMPDVGTAVDYSYFGLDVIGALAFMEGGIMFNTRDGRIITNSRWDLAEQYFVGLLREYRLVP